MAIELSIGLLGKLGGEAAAAHPQECCGILIGESGAIVDLIPAKNVHPTPETHFEIDPQTLIDAHRSVRGNERYVAGYYHSHPTGDARPSATDQAMSSGDGKIWAIIGQGETTFWRDTAEGFVQLSYDVVSA